MSFECLVVMRTSYKSSLVARYFFTLNSEHERIDFHTTDLQFGFHSIDSSADRRLGSLKYQLSPLNILLNYKFRICVLNNILHHHLLGI